MVDFPETVTERGILSGLPVEFGDSELFLGSSGGFLTFEDGGTSVATVADWRIAGHVFTGPVSAFAASRWFRRLGLHGP